MTRSDVVKLKESGNTRRRSEEALLPPCRICGSKASGYHYGVISCGACKAFFRRSIQMQTSYKCKSNDQCIIKPDERVPCSYCRFQKCLQLGMSKGGIKMGRYTIQRRSAVIQEVKNIEEQNLRQREEASKRQQEKEAEMQELITAAVEADRRFPLALPEVINDVSKEQRKYMEMKKAKESLYGSMKPISHNMYEHLFYSFGLELDDRRKRAQKCLTRCEKEIIIHINFAHTLPGFRELDIDDQLILLKDTQFEWLLFSSLPFFNTEEKLTTCPSCGFTASIEEASVIWEDGFDSSLLRCAEILKPLALKEDETAVIKALCLFNPDGCFWPPKDREKIGRIQQQYIDAFQFLLDKNGRDTAKVMGRIIHCITSLRGWVHRYCRKSQNWTTMFPGVKCPEMVLEWLGPYDYHLSPEMPKTKMFLMRNFASHSTETNPQNEISNSNGCW